MPILMFAQTHYLCLYPVVFGQVQLKVKLIVLITLYGYLLILIQQTQPFDDQRQILYSINGKS